MLRVWLCGVVSMLLLVACSPKHEIVGKDTIRVQTPQGASYIQRIDFPDGTRCVADGSRGAVHCDWSRTK